MLGIILFGILKVFYLELSKAFARFFNDSFVNLYKMSPGTLKISPKTMEISSGNLVRFFQIWFRDFSTNVELIYPGILESFLSFFA